MNFAAVESTHDPMELQRRADWRRLERFHRELLKERVLVGGGSRFVPTAAHTDADIDETLERIERAMLATQ